MERFLEGLGEVSEKSAYAPLSLLVEDITRHLCGWLSLLGLSVGHISANQV